jgi:hypothetical protein
MKVAGNSTQERPAKLLISHATERRSDFAPKFCAVFVPFLVRLFALFFRLFCAMILRCICGDFVVILLCLGIAYNRSVSHFDP